MVAIELTIDTWKWLSLNAEHYYGTLKGNGVKYEITRVLTGEDAAALNVKEDIDGELWGLKSRYYLKEGDETHRFDSKQDILDALGNFVCRNGLDIDVIEYNGGVVWEREDKR
jgi:hypothetical protein